MKRTKFNKKQKLYTFYRGNVEGEVLQLTKKEITERFIAWLDTKPLAYLKYQNIKLPRIFVALSEAGEGGLHSKFERDPFWDDLNPYLKQVYRKYMLTRK